MNLHKDFQTKHMYIWPQQMENSQPAQRALEGGSEDQILFFETC